MLVPMKDILIKATNEGYGVVAPNVIDERTARICIEAAEELHTPLILDVGYVFHPDLVSLGRLIEEMAVRSSVPIAVNLDHGSDFDQAIWAIRAGFTSVMVDRSMKSLEDNIKDTKEIVKIAHAVNVSVEAELGHVGDGFAYDQEVGKHFTDPKEAAYFVQETNVDCLAIAVGTAHGPYKGTPEIDFERLQEIRKAVSIPLVLHGGSGSGDENLQKAIAYGISKINIGTDLFKAAIEKGKEEGEIHMVYHRMQAGFKEMVMHYMHVFHQEGKA